MTVDISSTLETGFQRTFKQNGLMYAAIFFAFNVINYVLAGSLALSLGGTGPGMQSPVIALQLPPVVSGALFLVMGLLSLIATIGAMRTFVSDETETIPVEHFTRNIGLALLNFIVGSIAFVILLSAGFIAFVIPGFFLLVSLFFWNFYVVVEDQNFVEAMKNSWAATKGQRLPLFGLGLLTVAIMMALSIITSLPIVAALGQTSMLSIILQQIPTSVLNIFFLATAAAAYNQLEE